MQCFFTKIKLTTCLFLLTVALVNSQNASSSSYVVDSFHTGVSGSIVSSDSALARVTTTPRGSNGLASTTSYSFNPGWFSNPLLSSFAITAGEDALVSFPSESPSGSASASSSAIQHGSSLSNLSYCNASTGNETPCSSSDDVRSLVNESNPFDLQNEVNNSQRNSDSSVETELNNIMQSESCQLFGYAFGKFILCWYWWLVLFGIVILGVMLTYVKDKQRHVRKSKQI